MDFQPIVLISEHIVFSAISRDLIFRQVMVLA